MNPSGKRFYDLCARTHSPNFAFKTYNIKGYITVRLCVCSVRYILAVIRVECQSLWSNDAAALLPWSSPRSLDFHCFKNAVLRFCLAYDHSFSTAWCPALVGFVGFVGCHHVTLIFPFVVFNQLHESKLTVKSHTERWLLAKIFIKFDKIKPKKNTNQHSLKKDGG